MAITKTLVLTNELNDYFFRVHDKFMQNELYQIPLTVYRPKAMLFDKTRGILWVAPNTTGKVYKYSLTDIGYTLEGEITVSTYCGLNGMALDENTGDVYHINYTGTTISKIPGAGISVSTTLTVVTPSGAQSYPALEFIEERDELMVVWEYSNTSPDHNLSLLTRVDSSLISYEHFANYGRQFGYYYRYTGSTRCKGSHSSFDNNQASYNRVSKKMIYAMDNLGNYSFGGFLSIDPVTGHIDVWSAADLDTKNIATVSSIFVGRDSGTIYCILGNDVYKVSPGLKFIKKFTVLGQGADHMTFNDVSEEFYVSDYANNSVHVYTSNGDHVLTKTSFVNDVETTKIASAASDSTGNYITPARIVNPNNAATFTDDTPTVVFNVGSNPIGWTQQFRLIADTDETVIGTGDANTAYARVFDSWLAGTSYNDAGWEYSTDHDETNEVDPLNGTWAPLGSGEALRSGALNITDGLDANVANYYVRMTFPAISALTGAASNTQWFFKVYSYSKAV